MCNVNKEFVCERGGRGNKHIHILVMYLFAVNFDVSDVVFEHRGHVDLRELVLAEHDQETGLPTGSVSHYDQLFPDGCHNCTINATINRTPAARKRRAAGNLQLCWHSAKPTPEAKYLAFGDNIKRRCCRLQSACKQRRDKYEEVNGQWPRRINFTRNRSQTANPFPRRYISASVSRTHPGVRLDKLFR